MRYHFGPSVLRSRLLYRYTCKNVTGYDRVDIEMCQQNTFWNIDKKCSENNFMYSSYKKTYVPLCSLCNICRGIYRYAVIVNG